MNKWRECSYEDFRQAIQSAGNPQKYVQYNNIVYSDGEEPIALKSSHAARVKYYVIEKQPTQLHMKGF